MYSEYALPVDPDQDDKATVIRLCNFSRPHMRAFHCSWVGFFIAFFIWFAIAPFLGEIRDDLGLTNQEIWTSSIVGVGGTIFMRFILGPMCDKWGARIPMCKFTDIISSSLSLPDAVLCSAGDDGRLPFAIADMIPTCSCRLPAAYRSIDFNLFQQPSY
jgi:NNP family nitrate/nitrite transporter-like MFS transporter